MLYRRFCWPSWKVLVLFCSVVLLLIGLATPAHSEITIGRRSDRAPIVLDGKVLFRVNNLTEFTAKERAKQANDSLAQALREITTASPASTENAAARSSPPLKVNTSPGASPTLRLADRHLLTVTKRDVLLGKQASEQAEEWQGIINQAMETALIERTPSYQQRAIFKSGVAAVIAILLHCGIQWVRLRWRRQQLRTMQDTNRPLALLGLTGLQVMIWGGAGYYICELFPQFRTLLYLVLRSFDEPILTLNQQEYGIVDLLIVMGLILGLWASVRGLTLLLKSKILKLLGVNRGLQDAIAILTQYILTALGIVVILQVLGVDINALLIVGSALGLGIGFGLQNIVNNFISGIIILLDRPIEAGDFVSVGDLVGTVEKIGTRSTELRTLDEVTIIIPNAHFIEKEVVNWNHGSSVSRLHLPVSVAYGCDIEKVQQALLESVSHHPDILAYPQPQVQFLGFGESALDFEILIWFREPRQQYRLKSELFYQIEAKLRQYRIEIPFPQRDLHVRSPHLEQLIDLLVQQRMPKPPGLYYPGELRSHPQSNQPSPSSQPHTSEPLSQLPSPEINVDKLVLQMRADNGIEIQDRRHHLNIYPRCFIGSEAVEWLMRTQRATRQEAIRIGKLLIQKRIIHHVLDEHPFDDAYLFYRFHEDEQVQEK